MESSPQNAHEISNSGMERFGTYVLTKEDLETVSSGLETLSDSGLLLPEVLRDVRFVTYDSECFYIFTRGTHETVGQLIVTELPVSSRAGFKVYRVAHGGNIGKNERDYRGARAWLLRDEIENTAVDATKFPNENILYEPDVPQPKEILDTISFPPEGPYEKIQHGRFNYLTDVLFHEAGHIELRRLEDWHEGEPSVEAFPSEAQHEKFLSTLARTKLLPKWALESVTERITKRAINEMYPILIDHEAARLYDPERFAAENAEFAQQAALLAADENEESPNADFKESLESPYAIARILVHILEEQFPDFAERKQFVRGVLSRDVSRK